MRPKPRAEFSRELLPGLRFCIRGVYTDCTGREGRVQKRCEHTRRGGQGDSTANSGWTDEEDMSLVVRVIESDSVIQRLSGSPKNI